eukprot:491253-Lingulodinium_polyedra.AAC.1
MRTSAPKGSHATARHAQLPNPSKGREGPKAGWDRMTTEPCKALKATPLAQVHMQRADEQAETQHALHVQPTKQTLCHGKDH